MAADVRARRIDEVTRRLALRHVDWLARNGPLSWGPERRFSVVESDASIGRDRDVAECMNQAGWIACSHRSGDWPQIDAGGSFWTREREP